MKRCWMIAALVLVLLCCTAQAVELPVGEGTIHISAKDMWGEQWMFLPAFADRESLFPGAADIGDGFWEWTDENGDPLYILQPDGSYMIEDSFVGEPESDAGSDLLVTRAGYASLSIITWNLLADTPMADLTALNAEIEKQ